MTSFINDEVDFEKNLLPCILLIIDVVSDCFDNINNKKFSGAIALNIKKAFDSVDYNILLNKLEHYGIRGVSHKLFSNYLSNQQQYVAYALIILNPLW